MQTGSLGDRRGMRKNRRFHAFLRFNKVWIVPDDAEVMEKGNMAYVLKTHLKVMLEEDYLSLNKHNGIQSNGPSNQNKAHAIGS